MASRAAARQFPEPRQVGAWVFGWVKPEYTLEQMGRGELSSAYLMWKLARIPQGSIALIEEPETYLAMFSQDCLVDAIVSYVVDNDLCLVVSSHSPGFFQKLPEGNVTLVNSLPAPRVRSSLSPFEIARHLGAYPRVCCILFVEDVVAAEYLRALLSTADRDILRRSEIRVASSGESGVKRILSEVRSSVPTQVALLGILDGDQRPSDCYPAGSEFGYLVGTESPEKVLHGAVTRWWCGTVQWEPMLAGGSEDLCLSLERLAGREAHDWLHQLASTYDGLRLVVQAFVELLLIDEAYLEEVHLMTKWIRGAAKLE